MNPNRVAIVGIACRLPGGANDPETFWSRLAAGHDFITEVPRDRFDVDAYFQPGVATPGKMFTRWGAFLDRVDAFDPRFFRITDREAVFIDPQQRLLLETAWDALSDAGCPGDALAGSRTGVFVGISSYDYGTLIMEDLRLMSGFSGVGSALSIAANRISYCLDLHGPSLSVDTACSSSLVALHLACASLARGESERAIVGGVNVVLRPNMMVGFSQAAMMARDGRCKTFDAKADGFVRAEGSVVLVLKPLDAAIREGDRIHAVVRGSAVNQDGLTNGISAPSGRAQATVIKEALASACATPRDISYVEAHGTGTSIGDAMEIGALRSAYVEGRGDAEPLLVGSTKTNLGHAEAASGLVGVLKLILSFRAGMLPRHLHLETPNPHLGLEDGRIRIPVDPLPWPRGDTPRLAGVSAFGFGGTNAHAILEEPPAMVPATLPPRAIQVVTLHAKTETQLRDQATRAKRALDAGVSVSDFAHSLNTASSRFRHRTAIVARERHDLAASLDAVASGSPFPGVVTGSGHGAPRVAWLFSGQGSQEHGMGRALYEAEPVYRAAFDRVAAVVDARRSTRLAEVVFGGDKARVDETGWTQPALLATEWAIAELWRSWGVVPDFVVGHSVGEFAAAAVAGVFTIEDAARLVEARGTLMQSIEERGAMLSVALAEPEAEELIAPWSLQVSIAAVNAADSVVLSGAAEAIGAIARVCVSRKIESRELNVSHAFHSPLMSPILDAFEAEAARITFSKPRVPLVANLTGELSPAGGVTTGYWRRHLREPVRFAACVRTLLAAGANLMIEIGPGSTLVGLARRSAGTSASSVTSMRRGHDSVESITEAAASLDAAGVAIDWRARDAGRAVVRVPIPGYPFERKRYWLPDLGGRPAGPASHPLLGEPIELARSVAGEATFRSSVSTEGVPLLSEHRVFERAVFPGAGWIEMALAAARHNRRECLILDVTFEIPLWLDGAFELQLSTRGDAFEIHAAPAGTSPKDWTRHVSGRFAALDREGAESPAVSEPLIAGREVDAALMYPAFSKLGLGYGPRFRTIRRASTSPDQCVADLALPEDMQAEATAYVLHPGLLDGAFQALALAAGDAEGSVFLPSRLGRCQFTGEAPSATLVARARIEARSAAEVSGSITIETSEGKTIARLSGFAARVVDRAALAVADSGPDENLCGVVWRPRTLAAENPKAAEPVSRVLCTDARVVEALSSRGCDVTLIDGYGDGLTALQTSAAPTLIVTRGARLVGNETHRPTAMAAEAALWGLARVVNTERRAIVARAMDLDPAREDAKFEVEQIMNELGSSSTEEGVALRSRRRYVERLVPLDGRDRLLQSPAGRPFRLAVQARGSFHGLGIQDLHRRVPGAGEVEIRLAAAGLNFRDVMNALGTYPGDPGEIGIEGAGVIEAIGRGVAGLRVGDRVVAMHPGLLGSFATLPADVVARIPDHLPFEDAAALPVVYLTAHLALEVLARIRKGNRVLIHTAAGGVGLAAVQLALKAGAEVFATAGSEEKRGLLRTLGVAHVASSRTQGFADLFRGASAGHGVDVVLNALPGDFIASSLGLLAPGGCYIEIGKTGTWTPEQVRAFRADIRYEVLALDDLVSKDPGSIGRALQAVLDRFGHGELVPGPKLALPVERARAAFRHISLGRHIGKVVLTIPPFDSGVGVRVRPDGSYVVTGGRGGLGIEILRWLVAEGAGHVILVSRGELDAAGKRVADEGRRAGTRVSLVRADVTDRAALEAGLAAALASGPAWRGLIHAAGVLEDGRLEAQTPEGFERVSGPKNLGFAHLEAIERSLGASLDFCVATSSLAALAGNAGQAPYAASNLWLAEQVQDRRARGLAGIAIHFGPWDAVGMTATLKVSALSQLAASGVSTLSSAQGIAALRSLISVDHAEAGAFRIDFTKAHTLRSRSLFEESARETAVSISTGIVRLVDRIRDAPGQDPVEVVRDFVARQLAAITGATVEAVSSPDSRFTDFGLDSLMAIELRHRLQLAVEPELQLPANLLFSHPTIDAVARLLRDGLQTGAVSPGAATVTSVAEDRTELRLFAIPYAGGGASAYARWHGVVPAWLAFEPLQLPGREERGEEELLRGVPQLARYLADAIASRGDRPFAIFGHSLGAILAVATARELRRRAGVAPVHLALSGIGPSLDRLRRTFGTRFRDDPSGQMSKLESLGLALPLPAVDDATRRALMIVLEADLESALGHEWEDEPALDIETSLWGGRDDAGATALDLQAWGAFARPVLVPQILDGDHFYWREDPARLVSRLVEILRPYAREVPAA